MVTSCKNLLINLLQDMQNRNNDKPVTFITGNFGYGKSEFLNEFITSLEQINYCDAICSLNFNLEKATLADYLASCEVKFPNDDYLTNYEFPESATNSSYTNKIYSIVRERSPQNESVVLEQFKPRYFINTTEQKIISEKLKSLSDSLFEKKSDKRFLNNYYRVIAESFIVDLINLFYPVSEEIPEHYYYLSKIKEPVKIVMVFDNIDKYTQTILEWLNNEFVPLCIAGTFGDFSSFNIVEEQKHTPISRFIDFRFVITTRFNPQKNTNKFDYLSNPVISRCISLELLNYQDTVEYISNLVKSETLAQRLYQYSFGIPFLIDLMLDIDSEEISEVVRDAAYNKFTSKLLDGRTEIESEAIKLSVFLQSFEAEALRCSNIISDNYQDCFEYLTFTNDLYDFDNAQLSLKEPFREIIRKSLDITDKVNVIEYMNISKIYHNAKNRYPDLTAEELNIFRNLAYFKHFDIDNSITLAFDDKSASAKIFIKNHYHWFEKHQATHSVLSEHKNILEPYNRIIDGTKYELKKELISNIWNDRQKQLVTEKHKLKSELPALQKEYEHYNTDPGKLKSEYDSMQKDFIEKENELIRLRKSLHNYSYNKHIFSFVVNITASIMAVIIALFFPYLFQTSDNHTSVLIIQYTLYFISCVFCLIALNFAFKSYKLHHNKKEKNIVQSRIDEIEKDKLTLQDKMKELRDITNNKQKKTLELQEQIRLKSNRLDEIEILLNEPFI